MVAGASRPAWSTGAPLQAGGKWEIDISKSRLRVSVESVAGASAPHEQSQAKLFLRATTLEGNKVLRALNSVEIGQVSASWDLGSYKASNSWNYPAGLGSEFVPLNEGGVRLVFGAWLDSPGMGGTILDILSSGTFENHALRRQWADSVADAIADGSQLAGVSKEVRVSQPPPFLMDRSGYGTATVSYSVYLDPYITWKEAPARQAELEALDAVSAEVLAAEISARTKAEAEIAEKEQVIARLNQELWNAKYISTNDIEDITIPDLVATIGRLTLGPIGLIGSLLIGVFGIGYRQGRRRRPIAPSKQTREDRLRAYEHLRDVLSRVLRDATVSASDFSEIHRVVHDVELYFPESVAQRIRPLISDCAELYMSSQAIALAARSGGASGQHEIEVQKNSLSLQRILVLNDAALQLFKPHLQGA